MIASQALVEMARQLAAADAVAPTDCAVGKPDLAEKLRRESAALASLVGVGYTAWVTDPGSIEDPPIDDSLTWVVAMESCATPP